MTATYAAIFHMGGAVARVPHDATAYAARDVAHNIVIDAVWLPDESGEHAAAEAAWARRFLQALQPHRAGVYVNFLMDEGEDRIRATVPEGASNAPFYSQLIDRLLAALPAGLLRAGAFTRGTGSGPGARTRWPSSPGR